MSFNSLLIDTVDIVSKTIDKWQNATESTALSIRCRVMRGTQIVKNNRGEDVVSYAKLFFLPGQTIQFDDRIKIDGAEHPVVKISKISNSNSIHHLEVWVS